MDYTDVLLNFLFIKKTWRNSTQLNYNNNKKNFLEHIRILQWFLQDHVTGVMILMIQLIQFILISTNISQFYCTLDRINAG